MKMRRRRFIEILGAAPAVLVAQSADGRTVQVSPSSVQDPTKAFGAPPSAVGRRAPGVTLARNAYGSTTFSKTPLQDLHGTITPADLHFERHHAGVPRIDGERFSLAIHGMVDRPLTFRLADLRRFPSVTRVCFIECSGNLPRTRASAGPRSTPQDIAGMTSQTEWTGVALATIFREAGVKPGATWFLAEGSDAAVLTRSIPVEKGWQDAIVAYAQNGEPLRPENGYPLRLVLPGWEGNTNVKWLRRLELSDAPFMTREETAKYTEPLRDGSVRQFSMVMDARSIITFPAYPVTLERGWIEIRGIAWSGRGSIARVDVSTDAGRTWTPARLQLPALPQAHTRFGHMWAWDGQPTEIMSRAVDETGYVQPTRRELIDARGAVAVPYHLNPITAWRVERDGRVFYRDEDWQ